MLKGTTICNTQRVLNEMDLSECRSFFFFFQNNSYNIQNALIISFSRKEARVFDNNNKCIYSGMSGWNGESLAIILTRKIILLNCGFYFSLSRYSLPIASLLFCICRCATAGWYK